MSEESPRGSPARRLSQIFDPLARLTEYTHPQLSHSTPGSPRLLPRRTRPPPQIPPQPPPRPHAALDSLDQECHLAWHPETSSQVNWQERCLELQLELHRSRSQATRVRDMLRDKVGHGSCLFITCNACQFIHAIYKYYETFF